MIVTYSPEDGPAQRWEFAPRRIRARQAEEIERRYGSGWSSWVSDVHTGVISARRVLLWHLIRRDHAGLRFDDTPDFAVGELELALDAAELTELRDKTASRTDVEPEVRDLAVQAIEAQIADAPTLDNLGKATGPSDV